MKLEKVQEQVFQPLLAASTALHLALNRYMTTRTAFEKDPNMRTYNGWVRYLEEFKVAHFEWKKLFRTLNEGKRL